MLYIVIINIIISQSIHTKKILFQQFCNFFSSFLFGKYAFIRKTLFIKISIIIPMKYNENNATLVASSCVTKWNLMLFLNWKNVNGILEGKIKGILFQHSRPSILRILQVSPFCNIFANFKRISFFERLQFFQYIIEFYSFSSGQWPLTNIVCYK